MDAHNKVRPAAGAESLVWNSTTVNTLVEIAKSVAEQQCVSLVACSTNSVGQNPWCVSNLQGPKDATSSWVQGFGSSGSGDRDTFKAMYHGNMLFYDKRLNFVYCVYFFSTNIIFSMKLILLQRAQKDESNGVLFDSWPPYSLWAYHNKG